MSIKEILPSEKNYNKIKKLAKPRKRINYKLLASKIIDGMPGTILLVESTSNEPLNKDSLTNIKRSLALRGVVFDKHYSITFKTNNTKGVFYIIVKG